MSAALLEYLEAQQGIVFKKLYRQPSTVLAVLRRMLPHLAKSIVMAMLYMPEPFLESDLYTWIRTDCTAERDEALGTLKQLHILQQVQEPAIPRAYHLAPTFSRSLRQALTGGGNHRSFGVPSSTKDPRRMTLTALDDWARKKWEAILHYMVVSTNTRMDDQAIHLSTGTKMLLDAGGFVQSQGQRTMITKAGFSFLLQEANTQIWTLLIVYLEMGSTLDMEPVEVLSFLFTLGSLELGQDYSTEFLTPTQEKMLEDLSDFGIIYCRPDDKTRFYPTRLATTLTSDAGALLSSQLSGTSSTGPAQAQKGYIILETNHRLYAYTNSQLQINIIALFTNLNSRFPNLISGKITKGSINRAIQLGITSDQIISYITTHAHPQMLKNTPPLPPTVVDQIRLWQLEENRMKVTNGFLLENYENHKEYLDDVNYAETLGLLLWKSDEKRKYFVADINLMKSYLERKANAKRPKA
ncbi:RNA polymerase II transcription factor-like protein B subunit 2 [Tothia fuscella]|uniref:RNA polymerase II transcription factor B subunit 2 n=1 Tax=Tothia fuscella TaxID=1048955 RepID=A0A9P4TVT6_9PEZI|nr:RNA polymerase II transcription factor-like protein B subunit 2 [Tothia fuscella]